MDDTPPTNELIERLTARLSPAGREVERELQLLTPEGATTPDAELKARAREAAKLADGLPDADRDLIKRIMELRATAYGHQAEENADMARVARLAGSTIERAVELERAEGLEPDENMTLAEALAVLERHGERTPEGLDPNLVIKVPTTAKIEHKSARVILNPSAAESVPPDVKAEARLVSWAANFYKQAMLIAAGGVLFKTDSLDLAASVLWWAGFTVPPGYFPEDHEGADYSPGDEEALRLWVEQERENILQAVSSQGLYLAGTGRLMDAVEE